MNWQKAVNEIIAAYSRGTARQGILNGRLLRLLKTREPCAVSNTLDVNDPEWKAFVAAACRTPQDDTPQLVFCDWLQERYPGSSLEQMIRGMVEVGRYDPANVITTFGWLSWKDAYKSSSFKHYDVAYSGFLRSWRNWPPFQGNEPHRARQCFLQRGLLLRVVCSQEYWHTVADQVCSVSPVGEVVFVDDVDFWIETGRTVVQVSPRSQPLLKRLPHDPGNPHHTRVVSAEEWSRVDHTTQTLTLNGIGCELYGRAWAGRVGRFRVDELRDRENIAISPADVPAWPHATA